MAKPLSRDEIEQFRHMAESWKDMPQWALDLFNKAYAQLIRDDIQCFQMINLEGLELQAIFSNPTGARVNITSNKVTVRDTRVNGGELQTTVDHPTTFNARATDVFMAIDGVPHRLFVDIDIELPSGLKHIWLSDGPAVIKREA